MTTLADRVAAFVQSIADQSFCGVIDSDNESPRCGCPAEPWPLHISREEGELPSDVMLLALCLECDAGWEWGEVCATEGDGRC